MTPTDLCQRCGDGPDPDLRTIWMSSLYAMEELGLPFAQVAIRDGIFAPKIGSKPGVVGALPIYKAIPTADTRCDRAFYTLRVCKGCRADWLHAIRQWFGDKSVRESCGSGIYVRR